jgi:hypothetical protein
MAKILFDGVHLIDEVDRMGGEGYAYANTSYFSRPKAGYRIELDTVSNLCTITNKAGTGSVVIPLGRIKRFEPYVEAPPKEAPAAK